MQLFALDSEKKMIPAAYALKQLDYFCLECQSPVRLRAGTHRRKHFYHLQNPTRCLLHQKSMEHIQVQSLLFELLPLGDCALEYRFPGVQRIADVVWFSQKLIFEVQCSSIEAQEVRERNADYKACGFQVIWILHEKTFNKWRLSAAESYLLDFPHYFTNINVNGEGEIYDYYAKIKNRRRVHSLPSVAIYLNQPQLQPSFPKELQRRENWGIYFAGDLVDLYHQQTNPTYFIEISRLEFDPVMKRKSYFKNFFIILYRYYSIFFRYLLEKYCK